MKLVTSKIHKTRSLKMKKQAMKDKKGPKGVKQTGTGATYI